MITQNLFHPLMPFPALLGELISTLVKSSTDFRIVVSKLLTNLVLSVVVPERHDAPWLC